jgi:hypothetical protein
LHVDEQRILTLYESVIVHELAERVDTLVGRGDLSFFRVPTVSVLHGPGGCVGAAEEAWLLECRLFDVQVRLGTLRRVICQGAQHSRGHKQLFVIEGGAVGSVALQPANIAGVDYARSGVMAGDLRRS